MVEIKEGLELDRAVAEAIGLSWCGDTVCLIEAQQWDELFGHAHTNSSMDMPFMPSRHLDAAFAAAEKVGLFVECRHILGRGSANDPNEPWWVNHTEDRDEELSEYSLVGSGTTAALAICDAILHVTRRK